MLFGEPPRAFQRAGTILAQRRLSFLIPVSSEVTRLLWDDNDLPFVWVFMNNSVKRASQALTVAPVAGVTLSFDQALDLTGRYQQTISIHGIGILGNRKHDIM